jgi:integrase
MGSLHLRLVRNRSVKRIALRRCRLFENEWDKRAQKLVYPPNDPVRTGELKGIQAIINYELKMINRHIAYLESGGDYTLDELVRIHLRKREKNMLLNYTESLACALESKNLRRTARAYRTAAQGLADYCGGIDVPLEQITQEMINGLERSLQNAGKMPNTVAYYLRNLRAIYNKAVTEGKVVPFGAPPFAGISTTTFKTAKRALPLNHLQEFYSLDLLKLPPVGGSEIRRENYYQNLINSWRYFFFCIFARGMSWVDMVYLRKEDIRGGMIRYRRKKTGQRIEIKLTAELKSIISAFAGDVTDSPYVFPIIRDNGQNPADQYETSLRTQNNRLKKLAKMAGIRGTLTTHVARHSWASVGGDEQLPVRVISESLGHTSQETTLIYLSLLNNNALREADDIIKNAITAKKRTRKPSV